MNQKNDTPPSPFAQKNADNSADSGRQKRLEGALRANLRRRKTSAKKAKNKADLA